MRYTNTAHTHTHTRRTDAEAFAICKLHESIFHFILISRSAAYNRLSSERKLLRPADRLWRCSLRPTFARSLRIGLYRLVLPLSGSVHALPLTSAVHGRPTMQFVEQQMRKYTLFFTPANYKNSTRETHRTPVHVNSSELWPELCFFSAQTNHFPNRPDIYRPMAVRYTNFILGINAHV